MSKGILSKTHWFWRFQAKRILRQAKIGELVNATAVPVRKKNSWSLLVQNDNFCEAERFDNFFRTNSLKSIGFMCKSDNQVWSYVWKWFHFLLIFPDELTFLGRSVKAPQMYNWLKSIGYMCKNNTSHLRYFWCESHLFLFFLSNYCNFMLDSVLRASILYQMIKFFTKWFNSWLDDQILY